ncbi:hypothetical protein [Rossellomorea vietnamensis]|uniref:hypothetical protein n=1 Tax=Rossellomorea vietnamensis TaxID=218284 RepID=UPI000555C24C|nr:hypothetical protein [Rossellomorea vietnamensis]
MEIISTFALKGELLVLKEQLINLGLSLHDGKVPQEESVIHVARCIDTLDDIETLIKFNYYEG